MLMASALQTILRVLGGSGGDLFGYAAGLLKAIGCLECHSVKPIQVAAMTIGHPTPEEFPNDSGSPPASLCIDPPWIPDD
jgi:hypothetical protein